MRSSWCLLLLDPLQSTFRASGGSRFSDGAEGPGIRTFFPLSGPLRAQGIELEQGTVITTTWGEWRAEHPETTILAEDGGIGRVYDHDPLRGRDARGPIFPIGGVDQRLGVQSQVLGVESPDGRFVAFPVDEALVALRAGGTVELFGVTVVEDGGGLRAELPDGTAITSHQSFWFAWSQFHPDTVVWAPPPGG